MMATTLAGTPFASLATSLAVVAADSLAGIAVKFFAGMPGMSLATNPAANSVE